MKEIKNVDQLAAALPELMKDTKEVPATLLDLPAKVEDKSNMRKEPPIPEAPVVKTASEPPGKQEPPKKVKVEPSEEKKVEPFKEEKEIGEQKEEAIHNDAFKKEDDEIKEVEKQEILKKKEDLIEKLEENEVKQKKLLEEQKKILNDIKLEKDKLVIEKSELKIEEQPQKIKDGELNVQKEIVQKESVDIVKSKDENTINLLENVIHEPKIDIKFNSEVKEAEKVVKDDLIKKNMADGVPLPLAVQNIMPQIEVAKSLKIVDNPGNPNEGNADSKVLRREILQEGLKEQREKREVQDVFNVDSKVNNNLQKTEDVADNMNLDGSSEITHSLVLSNNVLQNNKTVVIPVDEINISSLHEKKVPLNEENDEHCEDKTKSESYKFSDELKPIEEIASKKALLSESPNNTLIDVKSMREVPKQAEEPIIKTPAYLSNPKIVLPDEKIPEEVLEGNILKNEAKPMKRDLKSVDMKRKRSTKESET